MKPDRRPPRSWRARLSPTPGGAIELLVAVVAVVLIAAACGGPSAPARSAGTSGPTAAPSRTPPSLSSEQLAFSRCIRSHGVLRFPDPDPDPAGIPKEDAAELGVSESQYQAAEGACRHLMPNGGAGPDQAQLAAVRQQSLRYSQCMRNHGIDLPDPDASGRVPDPASVGIDQGSPRFEAANQACARYRPPYMPSNEAYNAWARSQRS